MKKHLVSSIFFVFAFIFVLSIRPQQAFAQRMQPTGSSAIDISGKPGISIPLNVPFKDHFGKDVLLADFFGKGKPVVISMNYYSCPTLCGAQLRGLTAALKHPDLGLAVGKDFQVVTVSINPDENADLARKKRETYVQYLQAKTPLSLEDWPFLTGTAQNIDRLAKVLGFQYWFDEKTNQYNHAAGIFVMTSDGKLSQILYGVDYPPKTLRLALVEASQGRLGTPMDKALLLCYGYDPRSRAYALRWMFLMRVGASITIVGLAIFLGVLWTRERKKKRNG